MAMKDIESIKTAPGDENKITRIWMSFGWELKNKQRVKTTASTTFQGQDYDGTEHYLTTSGVDFFELTFERDTARKNYAELKSLEKQYYNIKNPYYPEEPEPPHYKGFWLALTVIGFLANILPGIIIVVVRRIIYSNKKKKWEKEYAIYKKELEATEKRRQPILEKAQSLV